MFTGLIEEIGKISRVTSNPEGKLFEILSTKVTEDLHIGDSVAVDGACLSVVSAMNDRFTAQAVDETLSKTTLVYFKSGVQVNLERAMPANGRFGGHFVQGHVDGVGSIRSIVKTGKSATITIQVPDELKQYIVPKGSIAINGISLTVASIIANQITVAVIPLTFRDTNLKTIRMGNLVNIEVDLLAKYIEQFVTGKSSVKPITEDTINSWGYGSKKK
ncbi:MAG: riboflavin synthase [Candidatus Marinimicrobia bacterium]|nr:riboflavin synthase [Candidatus Neomarinimicrobiota bacterium]